MLTSQKSKKCDSPNENEGGSPYEHRDGSNQQSHKGAGENQHKLAKFVFYTKISVNKVDDANNDAEDETNQSISFHNNTSPV